MAGPEQPDRYIPASREEDDPIAELSEIMRFDLAVGRNSGEEPGIDLENELMGAFSDLPEHKPGPEAPESEAEISADLAAAMREAFPEGAEEPDPAQESGEPVVPVDLESQLQALLAELDGGKTETAPAHGDEEVSADAGEAIVGPADPVGDVAAQHMSAQAWEEPDEAEAMTAEAPEPYEIAPQDPEVEFEDELSQVIAGLSQAAHPQTPEPVPVQQWAEDEAVAPSMAPPLHPAGVPIEEEMFADGEGQLPAQPAEFAPEEAMAGDAPEIETTELPDMIEPVGDDLDIPEIPLEVGADLPADTYLDNEYSLDINELGGFDQQRDELDEGAYAQEPQANAQPVRDDEFEDFLIASSASTQSAGHRGGVAAPAELDEISLAEPAYGPEASRGYGNGDLEDPDFYFAPLDEDEAGQGNGRRYGLMIAAAVATVAIAGGIGYFAFSDGGGGDGPALVQADPDPLKVKPENPGGAMAPNADKAVYDRVAGQGESERPAQQTLITTEEEPIDLAAATAEQPRVVLPSSGEVPAAVPVPADDSPASVDDAPVPEPAKAEDRILPEETDRGALAEEFVTVEPRRVRTLIVKPDGTLVPREEEAAPVTAEGLRTTTGSDALVAPTSPAVSGAAAEAGAGPTDDSAAGEVVPTPAPRTERAEAAPAASPSTAQPAAPSPVAERPADPPAAPATQVASAPTAPAGEVEYWVQVSSQPTRELAQASYTDIARRYGNLVAGRAVNIYPAEIEGRGTFYRVRVAGGSRSEANALCEQLKSAGAGCFVSR